MEAKCAFLMARDPSILACNLDGFENIKKNPEDHNRLFDEAAKDPTNGEEKLEVFLRIKNIYTNFTDIYETAGSILVCKLPQGSQSMRIIRDGDKVTKKYTFSKIFNENTTQSDIFNNVVKTRIVDFINGKNSTLLTYGASGSGKTYTAVGTDTEPGIIPRALEYLFRSLPQINSHPKVKPNSFGQIIKLSNQQSLDEIDLRNKLFNSGSMASESIQHIKTYRAMQQQLHHEPIAQINEDANTNISIWISFAEIYNEYIYDLLQTDQLKGKQRPKLKLIKAENGNICIKDLTSVCVDSAVDAYQVLHYGLNYLQYAATSVNSHSSRSHSIFTIKMVQVSKYNEEFSVSCFNFCDLAGSERLKKTLNTGDRLKESNNINTSLHVLHRCITCIRNSQKNNDMKLVPFRESKLTQLFQKALSGLENICMIVNISPELNMFDETQHVLNISAIAKDITVEPQKQINIKRESIFSQYMTARSTIIPSCKQTEAGDKEKEDLKVLVDKLYDDLQQEKLESEENEAALRNEIINEYKELIAQIEANWEKKYKDMESILKEEANQKCEELKVRYESELSQKSKRRRLDDSIIDLDDSIISLDDSVETAEESQTLQRENALLQKQLAELKDQSCSMVQDQINLKYTLKLKQEECKRLEKEVLQLNCTLEDAETHFKQQEELVNSVSNENKQLKAQVYMLEEQLSYSNKEFQLNKSQLLEAQEEIENFVDLNPSEQM